MASATRSRRTSTRPHRPVAVRAGARRRQRHRRYRPANPPPPPLGRAHARLPGRDRGGDAVTAAVAGPSHASPDPCSRPPRSATPSQKGSETCPSPPPRRSGWTASSSTGPTPPCTCSPTPCTTGPACSRASAPTRPPGAWPCSGCATHRAPLRIGPVFLIDIAFSVDDLVEATRELVRVNGMDDGATSARGLPRLRRNGPQSHPVPGERVGRLLAVGHLPGDEGVANGSR